MAQQKGSLPHYLAIKNELERRIISGQLKAGDRFPSEEELSQEFNVSTSTVKRAIGVLVADGLVERTRAGEPLSGYPVCGTPCATLLKKCEAGAYAQQPTHRTGENQSEGRAGLASSDIGRK